MTSPRPWLSTTTDSPAKAFPAVASVDVVLSQDPFGYYLSQPSDVRFTLSNLQPSVRCVNPRCNRGGLDLQQLIRTMVTSKTTEATLDDWCKGDEGSPAGRRKGEDCDNMFKGTVRITYKTSAG